MKINRNQLEVIFGSLIFAIFTLCWFGLQPGGSIGTIEWEHWREAQLRIQEQCSESPQVGLAFERLLAFKSNKTTCYNIAFFLIAISYIYLIWRADVSKNTKRYVFLGAVIFGMINIIFMRIR